MMAVCRRVRDRLDTITVIVGAILMAIVSTTMGVAAGATVAWILR